MQLPIDIKALLDEVSNIKAAHDMDVAVSVYIDEAAPADLAGHVRSAFTSASKDARITVSYLDASFAPHEGDDFDVIVAGRSGVVGPAATAIRALNVPVMVVAAEPQAVKDQAQARGHAIPEGDLVTFAGDCEQSATDGLELDEEAFRSLDDRMGAWVASVCREDRLAMSIAFPFMRRALAKDAVQLTAIQNAGVGLVPFIPGADLPIMTLNQAKMVLQIAAAYGKEMDKNRVKELAAVVGGAYLCRVVARELVEFIPVLGFVIKPGIAYGGTSAVGYAAIDYFEGGENAAGVMNAVTHAANSGSKLVENVRSLTPEVVKGALLDKAKRIGAYMPVVGNTVKEYTPVVVDLAKDVKESVAVQARAVRVGS